MYRDAFNINSFDFSNPYCSHYISSRFICNYFSIENIHERRKNYNFLNCLDYFRWLIKNILDAVLRVQCEGETSNYVIFSLRSHLICNPSGRDSSVLYAYNNSICNLCSMVEEAISLCDQCLCYLTPRLTKRQRNADHGQPDSSCIQEDFRLSPINALADHLDGVVWLSSQDGSCRALCSRRARRTPHGACRRMALLQRNYFHTYFSFFPIYFS